MDGQMRLYLKVGRQGYNWPFLTLLDFAIIFHLKNYFPCLVWCHCIQHNLTCDCTVIVSFLHTVLIQWT